MPQTRSAHRSTTSSVLHNCDVLHVMTSFLNIKDIVNISHTSKKMSAVIDEVALRIVASSHLRYGGDDEENLSALKLLKLLLHSPIEFASLLGERLEYVREDKSCVHSSNPNPLYTPDFICHQTIIFGGDWDGWEGETVTAICSDYIMTSGKHYAKFTLSVSSDPGDLDFRYFYPRIGIMRPLNSFFREAPWPQFDPMHDHLFTRIFLNESFAEKNRTDLWGGSDVHCCLYYDLDGTCEWTNWDSTTEGIHTDQRWDGMREASILGGREFGMLLDLDEGTLSLYKQGRCLGVMMRGLTGEYCWVANILAQANGSTDEQNVRIEKAEVPS